MQFCLEDEGVYVPTSGAVYCIYYTQLLQFHVSVVNFCGVVLTSARGGMWFGELINLAVQVTKAVVGRQQTQSESQEQG